MCGVRWLIDGRMDYCCEIHAHPCLYYYILFHYDSLLLQPRWLRTVEHCILYSILFLYLYLGYVRFSIAYYIPYYSYIYLAIVKAKSIFRVIPMPLHYTLAYRIDTCTVLILLLVDQLFGHCWGTFRDASKRDKAFE